MRFARALSLFITLVGLTLTAAAQAPTPQAGAPPAAAQAPAGPPFRMTIAGFADGTDIPVKSTQAGNQTSPAITWVNAPAGTVTFFLNMHDMEVSRNRTTDDQVHWIVWNIPGTET